MIDRLLKRRHDEIALMEQQSKQQVEKMRKIREELEKVLEEMEAKNADTK